MNLTESLPIIWIHHHVLFFMKYYNVCAGTFGFQGQKLNSPIYPKFMVDGYKNVASTYITGTGEVFKNHINDLQKEAMVF